MRATPHLQNIAAPNPCNLLPRIILQLRPYLLTSRDHTPLQDLPKLLMLFRHNPLACNELNSCNSTTPSTCLHPYACSLTSTWHMHATILHSVDLLESICYLQCYWFCCCFLAAATAEAACLYMACNAFSLVAASTSFSSRPRAAASGGGTALPTCRWRLPTWPEKRKWSGKPCVQ